MLCLSHRLLSQQEAGNASPCLSHAQPARLGGSTSRLAKRSLQGQLSFLVSHWGSQTDCLMGQGQLTRCASWQFNRSTLWGGGVHTGNLEEQ